MQFKLLGSVGTFGLITLCLLNTERIFKMITKNHDALVRTPALAPTCTPAPKVVAPRRRLPSVKAPPRLHAKPHSGLVHARAHNSSREWIH